jgi:hypothetical protein
MLRFYLRLAIVMLPLFVLLTITMGALASTQPMHPALRGFVEGCEGIPQPCWYGIVPGVTTINEASIILENLNFNYLTAYDAWASYRESGVCDIKVYEDMDGYVDFLEFTICGLLTFKDVVTFFDFPLMAVSEDVCIGGTWVEYDYLNIVFDHSLNMNSLVENFSLIAHTPAQGIFRTLWRDIILLGYYEVDSTELVCS